MEFDFIAAPGAPVERIGLTVSGVSGIELDRNGDLPLRTDGSRDELRLRKPVVYQHTPDGRTERLDGGYSIARSGRVRFNIPRYDPRRTLVIDPTVTYATFFGGSRDDGMGWPALDAVGNIYVAGTTYSSDLPVSAGAYRTTIPATISGSPFVAKFTPDGKHLIYCTYYGGSQAEIPAALAVDPSGNAYLFGYSHSSDIPLVNPVRQTYAGAFVAKFSPDGARLVYSTYLGGSWAERPWGIAVDAGGNAVVVGLTGSRNFPLVNALQTEWGGDTWDGFVAKIAAQGSSLIYSTLLGGDKYEEVRTVAIGADGSVYVGGMTRSPTFPTTPGAFQREGSSGDWGFVARLDPSGSRLLYSTFLPGEAYALTVNAAGEAWVTGHTRELPATPDAFQRTHKGGGDAYLVRLNPSGSSLLYATFLGGSAEDTPYRISVDGAGNVFVSGMTYSGDFPIQSSMFASGFGFVTALQPGGGLLYSTLLPYATLAVGDRQGTLYLAGGSASMPAPPSQDALQAQVAGGTDGILYKLIPANPIPATTRLSPSTLPYGVGAFSLIVEGSNFVSGAVVRWNGSDRPTRFNGNTQLVADITAADIVAPGSFPVSVFNPAPAGGLSNPTTFRVHPNPVLNANGGVSAAAYKPDLVAGSIASLFGWNLATTTQLAAALPLPMSMGGAVLRVNGVAAPLFYVSRTQINFQVPWEVQGEREVTITVSRDGNVSEPLTTPTAGALYEIFTVDQSGRGQGAVLIDGAGSLAAPASLGIPGARPVRRGKESIQIYCNAIGGVTNQPASGLPAVAAPLSIADPPRVQRIIFAPGVSAMPTFAGLAPGFVGLCQVNVPVPANASTGDAINVTIALDLGFSNTVTIAIQD